MNFPANEKRQSKKETEKGEKQIKFYLNFIEINGSTRDIFSRIVSEMAARNESEKKLLK